jgi:ABC-type Fe3+/spermidine/putrescine transport system ATPase subunit
LGPNGSGKSTILRLLSGIHQVPGIRARIVIDGQIVENEEGIKRAPEQRKVGYVPQQSGLFPHLSVLENVAFGWSTGKHPKTRAVRLDAAAQILKSFECIHLAERSAKDLSGGERQQVALARALLTDPALSALDASRRQLLRSSVKEYVREHETPCIVVTHDLRDVLALNAQVYVIEAGRVTQSGPIDELRSDPKTEFVAEFLSPLSGMEAPTRMVPGDQNLEGAKL